MYDGCHTGRLVVGGEKDPGVTVRTYRFRAGRRNRPRRSSRIRYEHGEGGSWYVCHLCEVRYRHVVGRYLIILVDRSPVRFKMYLVESFSGIAVAAAMYANGLCPDKYTTY